MREPESLEDSTLDRELQALLTVDPSPHFAARVRMSVSTQRVARRFASLWLVGSVAAAAAAIVVGISLSARRESLNVDVPHIVAHSRRDIQLPAVPPARPREEPDGTTAFKPLPRVPRVGQPAVVVVWREDAEAFHELVSDIAERRFEVVHNAAIPQETGLVTNVAIAPIVFEPIELSPIDTGAFQ